MRNRLTDLIDRSRGSLFFVPMVFVIVGVALGLLMTKLDTVVEDAPAGLPFVLTSTVDSARSVLSVIASATITVAGIAFSISLLVIQQSSSQFSPRVVHSLFRDPFNRRVMGVSVGTFTYCLMVLRAVRSPLEDGGQPVIPNLSVAAALLFGVAAILAIVAFIDHNAHSLEVSEILTRVTRDTMKEIDETWREHSDDREGELDDDALTPRADGHAVPFTASGWLQRVDSKRLMDLVSEGGTVRLETTVGRYAVEGTPLCTLWPAPDDAEEARNCAARAVLIGNGRTLTQDPSYGIRQLADVALIALSPGVNDPTTAQDAIFNLTAVLRDALVRDLPARVEHDDHGRRLLRAEDPTHETLVTLGFVEIRQAAAAMPVVCTYLLEALYLLHEALADVGLEERIGPLRREADRVLAEIERADVLPADLHAVRREYEDRFGDRPERDGERV